MRITPAMRVHTERFKWTFDVHFTDMPEGYSLSLANQNITVPSGSGILTIGNLPRPDGTQSYKLDLLDENGERKQLVQTVKIIAGKISRVGAMNLTTTLSSSSYIPEIPPELLVTTEQVSAAKTELLQSQIDIPAYEASIEWLSATQQNLISEIEGLLSLNSEIQSEIGSPAPALDQIFANEQLARETLLSADHRVRVLSNRVSDLQQHEHNMLELLLQREAAKQTALDQLQLLTEQLSQSQNLPQTQSNLLLQHAHISTLVVALQTDISSVRAILVSLVDNIDESTSVLTDPEFLDTAQEELDLEIQEVEVIDGEYQSALSTLATREAERDVEQSQFDSVNSVTEAARHNSESADAHLEQRYEEVLATLRRIDELRDYWDREVAPFLVRGGSINNWNEYQEAEAAWQHANQRHGMKQMQPQ